MYKRHDPAAAFDVSGLNFTHGVSSGDPYPTSVILWTRCSPVQDDVNDNNTVTGVQPLYNPVPIYNDDGSHIATSKAPVCLQFKIAGDRTLKQVVDSGTVYTSSDVDYTVKVEAQHLRPFTTYYYQFNVCGSDRVSPLGRTKTAPAATDDVNEISLAVYSCSNFRKFSPLVFFNTVLTREKRSDSLTPTVIPQTRTALTMFFTSAISYMNTRTVTTAKDRASVVFHCQTRLFSRSTTTESDMQRIALITVCWHQPASSLILPSGTTTKYPIIHIETEPPD